MTPGDVEAILLGKIEESGASRYVVPIIVPAQHHINISETIRFDHKNIGLARAELSSSKTPSRNRKHV
jgi:hypothetical protein